MSNKHLYKFGDFELCTDESVLQRDGRAVPLTPKMYEMLRVLVSSHGKVVDKETILKEVWPDSFVEEGNITFNIRQLRKALDDNAQSPSFIETVPRRGYRFIADVEEVEPKPTAEPATHPAPGPEQENPAQYPHRRSLIIFAAAVLMLAGIVGGSWFLLSRRDAAESPLLARPFSSEKLSTTGLVYSAAISPDGQWVAYSVHAGLKQSLWLRELATSNNLEILPPTEGGYYDIVFSPDGGSIYFSRGDDNPKSQIDIYRIPVRGGIPQKIVNDTEGWVSLSPDGSKMTFVRCPRRDDEYCSLWIADSGDGANERKLATRPSPIRIADHEISPDGTRVAFAAGQSRNQANDFKLMEVGMDGGSEREITAERFFNVKAVEWLPDRSGLLVTASQIPNKHFRIWNVPVNGGDPEPLTKDSETYAVLGLDRSGERLVSTRIEQDFRAYRFDMENPSERLPLADATSATFAPDGRVYFTSLMSGNDEIWSMNRDGSEQRQLTNSPADDRYPIVSADGRTVYFSSNRTGEARVWRIDADGSNPTMIPHRESGVPIYATPDGRSLYYRRSLDGTLWAVTLETGEEKRVLDHNQSHFAFSPGGERVAYVKDPLTQPILIVASPQDGAVLDTVNISGHRSTFVDFCWNPDGRSLVYAVADAQDGRYKVFRYATGGPPPHQLLDLGFEEVSEVPNLSVSRDGKHFILIQGRWKHNAVLIQGLK